MKMTRRLSFAAAATAWLLSGSAVHAQQPAQPAAVVKDAEATMAAVSVSAVVTAVDAKNRIVTLEGPQGNEFSVLADDAVKNFAQIKVGDTLTVKYIRAAALDFKKGDGIRMRTVIDTADSAKQGAKPGAMALTRVNTVSNIWAVNPAQGSVLVRGPYGHFTEVFLKDPTLLSGVKVGDQMQITYTQAVAIEMAAAK